MTFTPVVLTVQAAPTVAATGEVVVTVAAWITGAIPPIITPISNLERSRRRRLLFIVDLPSMSMRETMRVISTPARPPHQKVTVTRTVSL